MIFQTIQGENGNTQIVTSLKARAMAQQKAEAQLATDIQCLKEYEIACNQAGITTQELASKLEGASVRAQEYAVQIKNATGTAQMYAQNNQSVSDTTTNSTIISKFKKIGKTLGNIAGLIILSTIFQLVTSGIEYALTYKKRKSEKADKEYEKSSEKVKQNEEEAKSLDNLIKKYEELRSKDDVDTSARKN